MDVHATVNVEGVAGDVGRVLAGPANATSEVRHAGSVKDYE